MARKFIIFDIWADLGHFKKYYTTSSPLTFSIPPRTAIIGLIGAIIGLKKQSYLKELTKDKADIAVRIMKPIKKIQITHNLINTKDNFWIPKKTKNHEPRTQVCFEYIKDPHYRIYFSHKNENIYYTLINHLKEHKSYYTPYLGISACIADFCYVDEAKEISTPQKYNNFIELFTVVPIDLIEPEGICIEKDKKYFKEQIPVEMLPERIVKEYREVIFEPDGKSLKLRCKEIVHLNNGEIITIL